MSCDQGQSIKLGHMFKINHGIVKFLKPYRILVVQNFHKTFNLYNNTNLGILNFGSQKGAMRLNTINFETLLKLM
jgi:hypothetical protein